MPAGFQHIPGPGQIVIISFDVGKTHFGVCCFTGKETRGRKTDSVCLMLFSTR